MARRTGRAATVGTSWAAIWRRSRLRQAAASTSRIAAAGLGLQLLAYAGPAVAQTCVDAATLAHSTGNISRYFDSSRTKGDPDLLGIRGTGWFLSETTMVTAEHVVTAMELSDERWSQVEIVQGQLKQFVATRIQRVAGSHAEKIAILELRERFAGAQGLRIRLEPVAREEQVVSLVYPGNRPRFVRGRFVEYADAESFAGSALLEMYDGNDRLALDHGASGAPVLDCDGRVVAVISNIFTQTLHFPFRDIRVSTAWGSPNVVSIPIQVLAR
jgi:hypothetical protein